jgi:hypothetical protein
VAKGIVARHYKRFQQWRDSDRAAMVACLECVQPHSGRGIRCPYISFSFSVISRTSRTSGLVSSVICRNRDANSALVSRSLECGICFQPLEEERLIGSVR